MAAAHRSPGEGQRPAASSPAGPRRGPAWLAVGVVTLIAVVSAGGVLGLARVTGATEPQRPAGLDEELPDELPGGVAFSQVPEAVAAAFDVPVVGAPLVDPVPPEVAECPFGEVAWEGAPQMERAMVTPQGLVVVRVGLGSGQGMGMEMEVRMGQRVVVGGAVAATAAPVPAPAPTATDTMAPSPAETPVPTLSPPMPPPPPPMPALPPGVPGGPMLDGGESQLWRAVCLAEWTGDGWSSHTGSTGPVGFGDTGAFGTCCDRNGRSTAGVTVAVPEGAAWAVQDRGGYALAYPAEGLDELLIVWPYRESPFGGMARTRVEFVDADGEVIEERHVGL